MIDPLDPTTFALTPGASAAQAQAALHRRLSSVERSSLNGVQTKNENAEWQAPALENFFADLGGGYAPASYYKDTFGRVYLRGVVRNTSSGGGAGGVRIFTLAAGYLPVYTHQFPLIIYASTAYKMARVSLAPDGGVLAHDFALNDPVSLDGISFRTL